MSKPLNILIIEARFYDEIADGLLAGTKAALKGHAVEVITVPGILELPSTLLYAWKRGASPDTGRSFDGAVVLGCAVKGETDHYDFVCGESAAGITQVQLTTGVPCAFGVITCDTREQAEARSGGGKRDSGRNAAVAAAQMHLMSADERLG